MGVMHAIALLVQVAPETGVVLVRHSNIRLHVCWPVMPGPAGDEYMTPWYCHAMLT
jgi:hypothetical protein